jgi:hypothetical protein
LLDFHDAQLSTDLATDRRSSSLLFT